MVKLAIFEGKRAVIRDAAITALVVGPILTLINHGDKIVSLAPLPWAKVALTFLVPFLVAMNAGLRAARRAKADP